MSSYVELLFQKYQSKGLLIDANLLLLCLVGSYDTRLIGDGKYNKLSKYTTEDFNLLLRLKAAFANSATTAHVLTEVSNLVNDLPESTKVECLSEFVQVFGDTKELEVASFEVAKRSEFRYLGLTDCALAEVSSRFLVVTDDARLVAKLGESGLEALNFNHLREYLLPQ